MRARVAQQTWVADVEGEVVGFCDLTDEDEIGMLYLHPDFTRQGIGSALLDEAERQARKEGRARLMAHVSLVAEPVFARAGFVLMQRERVERQGQWLARAVMQKVLEPI